MLYSIYWNRICPDYFVMRCTRYFMQKKKKSIKTLYQFYLYNFFFQNIRKCENLGTETI